MHPPRLSKGTVERARLMNQLTQARHRTCVVLQGPAGCGKTTLALQWRAQLIPFGFDFAWLTVTSGVDAESLLESFFASLSEVDGKIAREAAVIYNRDGQTRSVDAIAISLLNGLIGHGRDIVILIDDFHNVTDPRAHHLVQTLVDFAPTHLHVVIASRSAPPLSLSRLRAAGAILELDFSQLRFTFSEAESFLQAQYPDLLRRDARLLYDMTDGWGAGLRLVSLDLKRRLQSPRKREPIQNAQEFTAYFNRQVLAQLSPLEIDALARLSIAQRFSEGLCATLFGAEAGMALMNRLRRDNMFLIPVEGGVREAWYRFHPLFRDVLRQRFDLLGEAERRGAHARLGEWFGKRKHLLEAVKHCVAAGDVEQAADLLERDAREMFLAGELRRLVRAVAELPPQVLRSRLSLRLWVAWSQLCYRHLIECHQTLEALKSTSPRADVDTRHHLTLIEGSLAIQDDDTSAGERLLPALDRLPTTQDAILAGGRRNILGWLNIHLGQFEKARGILAGPVQFLEGGAPLLDSAFGSLLSQCMLGYSYVREGDMAEAEHVLREVVTTSDRVLGVFSEAACNAASFLGFVHYETNRLDGVRALIEPRFDVIERVALPEALICAAVTRVRLHCLDGSRQEALAELERLEEQGQRRGLSRVHAYALAERAMLHVCLGELDAAGPVVRELENMATGHRIAGTAASRNIEGLASWTRVRWLAACNEPAQALDEIRSLMAKRVFEGQLRKAVQLETILALLEHRLGRHEAAQERLDRVLEQARRLALVRSLLDAGTGFLVLGEEAQGAGRLTPGSSFYFEHVKLQIPAPAAAAAGYRPMRTDSSQESLSDRELDILKSLASTMSNKRIAQALGVSPETVKWHLKNIYSKLGVYGRDGAVAKARDLGWVEAGSR